MPQPLTTLDDWLPRVPAALRAAVRARVEGERVALPGLALAPYLIGLLVMLGMLGTFLGMVVTFKGAVLALEGSTDMQAIRSALAAPIRGLGLSFGTSVAGVATSAMLGLMAALSRRERVAASRALDALIAADLRPFSQAQRRQESFQALQRQAEALPDVADRLQALMAQIEQRGQQMDEQLLARQQQFHSEAAAAYTGLARSVEQSLKDSLAASARTAGESLQPIVTEAMAAVSQSAARLHEQVGGTVQAQVEGLCTRLGESAVQSQARLAAASEQQQQVWTASLQAVATDMQAGWQQANAQAHAQQQAVLDALAQTAAAVTEQAVQSQARQAEAGEQQRAAWVQSLQAVVTDLQTAWQQSGEQARAQQQAMGDALAKSANAVVERTVQAQAQQAEASEQRHAAWLQSLQAVAADLQAGWQRTGEQAQAQQQAVCDVLVQTATAVTEQAERSQARLAETGERQHAAWAQALQAVSADLQAGWQRAGEQTQGHQQAVSEALAQATRTVAESATEQAQRHAEGVERLLAQSEALMQARAASEAQWHREHGERMDALAALWRSELAALRTDEAERSQSAAQRLGALQDGLNARMAEHLGALGQALEAPMGQLLATASDAPRAAAEVIAKLREEMSRLTERDNTALQERAELVQQIGGLLDNVRQATGEQREAIESLVRSASGLLEQAGRQLGETVDAQAAHAQQVSTQVAESVEGLAALGTAFQDGVAQFGATSAQLTDSLQRIEGAVGQSMARSDEQLAYYVAQAREVIDLSISAQQGIVEDLRRLHRQPAAPAVAAGGQA